MSKAKSYLGVDIGAHGIKLVEIKNTKGRPQLWTYGILDKNLDVHLSSVYVKNKDIEELSRISDNVNPLQEVKNNNSKLDLNVIQDILSKDTRINEYAEMLKFLVKQSKVDTKYSSASLPVSQVFHTVINLPKVEEKMIPNIIKAEVAKMIPFPIEEMQIIPQRIPTENNNGNITMLVTAAPKILISFYSIIFQKAGLELMELETEAFALTRSLVGLDKMVTMVLDVGAERTNFFIVDNATPMTYRSLHIGGNDFDKVLATSLGTSVEEAKKIKISLSGIHNQLSLDDFLPVLDPIIKEIKYSFDLYLRQSGNIGKKPEKIILTGGSSLFPLIKDYIAKEFDMKIFVGNPWARVIHQDGIKKMLDDLGPRMSVSIGLALRNF
ncbi:MAG: pilus assembly protein PilM [Candidatus Magasanikbacteria bacterium]